MIQKPLVWLGTSLDDARSFPPDARRVAGHQLFRVQRGLMPQDVPTGHRLDEGEVEARAATAQALAEIIELEVVRMSVKVTKSSGNVFIDLGFPAEEAENLRIRSDLMCQVIHVIESRSLTQKEAADLFGVTQPRVSDLVCGKGDLFSIDMLVKMLAAAGIRVSLTVEPAARGIA